MLIVTLCKVLIVPVLSHLISFRIFSSAGADSGGGNAYLSSYAHHVSLQTAPVAVWVQWACCQPPSGCGLILSESAPPFLYTGCHCCQEGGGPTRAIGTSVSDVQWCLELSSGWSHTTSTTTLWV